MYEADNKMCEFRDGEKNQTATIPIQRVEQQVVLSREAGRRAQEFAESIKSKRRELQTNMLLEYPWRKGRYLRTEEKEYPFLDIDQLLKDLKKSDRIYNISRETDFSISNKNTILLEKFYTDREGAGGNVIINTHGQASQDLKNKIDDVIQLDYRFVSLTYHYHARYCTEYHFFRKFYEKSLGNNIVESSVKNYVHQNTDHITKNNFFARRY